MTTHHVVLIGYKIQNGRLPRGLASNERLGEQRWRNHTWSWLKICKWITKRGKYLSKDKDGITFSLNQDYMKYWKQIVTGARVNLYQGKVSHKDARASNDFDWYVSIGKSTSRGVVSPGKALQYTLEYDVRSGYTLCIKKWKREKGGLEMRSVRWYLVHGTNIQMKRDIRSAKTLPLRVACSRLSYIEMIGLLCITL